MENDFINFSPGYMYHSGILGMRHGIRRWQLFNGTMTPEGRIRYNADSYGRKSGSSVKQKVDEISKAASQKKKEYSEKRAVVKKDRKNIGRSPSRMTDEELSKAISRLRMEKTYRDLLNDSPMRRAGSRAKQELTDVAWKTSTYYMNKAMQSLIDKRFSTVTNLDAVTDKSSDDVIVKANKKLETLNKLENYKKTKQENEKIAQKQRELKDLDKEYKRELLRTFKG